MIKVNLEHFNSVKDFINISQECTSGVLLSSGKYTVDAKSILGIFSLDLSKPVELICENEDDYRKFSNWFVSGEIK